MVSLKLIFMLVIMMFHKSPDTAVGQVLMILKMQEYYLFSKSKNIITRQSMAIDRNEFLIFNYFNYL